MSEDNYLSESGTIELNNQLNPTNEPVVPVEPVEQAEEVVPTQHQHQHQHVQPHVIEKTEPPRYIPPHTFHEDHSNIPPEDSDTIESGRISASGLAIAAIISGILIISAGYVAYRYFNGDSSSQFKSAPVAGVQVEKENGSDSEGQITSGVSTSRAEEFMGEPGDSYGIVPLNYYAGVNTPPQQPQTVVEQPQVVGEQTAKPVVSSSPTISSGIQATNVNSAWEANNYDKGDINSGSYTVVRGDTLWEIAQGVYGDGGSWHKIADANHVSYLANGHPLILPGQVLTIPV